MGTGRLPGKGAHARDIVRLRGGRQWDLGNDPALIANGRIVDVVDSDGHTRKLVANPVKFDDGVLSLSRAPQFAEHTDEVLRELGIVDEELIELKIADAVT